MSAWIRSGASRRSAAQEAEYLAVRSDLAKTETPLALIWIGCLAILLSMANLITDPDFYPQFHLIDVIVAAVLIVCGLLLRRPSVPALWSHVAFAACMVLLVYSLLAQQWISQESGLAYGLIAMGLLGPLTLAWRPTIVGSIAMVAGVAVVSAHLPGAPTEEWTLLAVTAAMAGVVLLQVRLVSVHGLARALVAARDASVIDPLTGVLNRRGLEQYLAGFAANAKRLREPVRAYFVDIDGLKAANDRHGHAFGDEVITSVAAALRASVREGDLVARWGGDEFVVVGMGREGSADDLQARMSRRLADDSGDLSGWSGAVSVGVAFGEQEGTEVASLIDRADQDMYQRRAVRRG